MIEIEFNCFGDYWFKWKCIGQFTTLELAIEAIEKKDYALIKIDDYTYQGIYIKRAGSCFRFVDIETRELISIESPWKVGLNK